MVSLRSRRGDQKTSPRPQKLSNGCEFFRPRHNLLTLGRDLLIILTLNVMIMAIFLGFLYGFSKMGDLNMNKGWNKRIFNSLSLILGSTLSLGIGWLINEVGRIIRWPLLYRRPHKIEDVDSILLLGSLSAASELLFRHLVSRKTVSWSTMTVSIYLLTALSGRLSVALLGLAFNLNDSPFFLRTYDIQATVWPDPASNGSWVDAIHKVVPTGLDSPDALLGFALAGLRQYALQPAEVKDICNNACGTYGKLPLPTTNVTNNLQLQNISQSVDTLGSSVNYEYKMRNFNISSNRATASNRTIAANGICTWLNASTNNEELFIDPAIPSGKLNVTTLPTGRSGENLGQNISSVPGAYTFVIQENVLVRVNANNHFFSGGYTTAYEYNMTSNSNSCGERCSELMVVIPLGEAVEYMVFHCSVRLGTVSSESGLLTEDTSVTDKRAVLFTSLLGLDATSINGEFDAAEMDDDLINSLPLPQLHREINATVNQTVSRETIIFKQANSFFKEFAQGQSYMSYSDPLFGAVMPGSRPDQVWNDTVVRSLELWMAGLMARVPIVTIAFLDNSGLFNRTNISNGTEIQGTTSKLDVEWPRALAICGVLVGLQAVTIAVALLYCRDVVIKDHSALVIGQVLKSVSGEYQGGSLAGKKELAAKIGTNSEFLYGTIQDEASGAYQIDLRRRGENLVSTFPEGVYI